MKHPTVFSLQVVRVLIMKAKSNMSNSASMISSFCCVDVASKLYGKNTDRPLKSPSLLLTQWGRSLSVRRVQRVLEIEAPLIPPSREQPYL